MSRLVCTVLLVLPTVAWADVSPGGCGCDVGVLPAASGLVVGAVALLLALRR
jgi:hypothetical protein